MGDKVVMAVEDLSVTIRRTIYNDYQNLKEQNPNSSREEILKLLHQEFVTTSITCFRLLCKI